MLEKAITLGLFEVSKKKYPAHFRPIKPITSVGPTKYGKAKMTSVFNPQPNYAAVTGQKIAGPWEQNRRKVEAETLRYKEKLATKK